LSFVFSIASWLAGLWYYKYYEFSAVPFSLGVIFMVLFIVCAVRIVTDRADKAVRGKFRNKGGVGSSK
jgi:hypothetical protein